MSTQAAGDPAALHTDGGHVGIHLTGPQEGVSRAASIGSTAQETGGIGLFLRAQATLPSQPSLRGAGLSLRGTPVQNGGVERSTFRTLIPKCVAGGSMQTYPARRGLIAGLFAGGRTSRQCKMGKVVLAEPHIQD